MFKAKLVILTAVALLSGSNPNAKIGFYANTAEVVEINREADIFTVEDFTGNRWDFTEVEDWEKKDLCAIIFCDNGTPEIEDDIPISWRYCGYVD